jgi:hypothetical protein
MLIIFWAACTMVLGFFTPRTRTELAQDQHRLLQTTI